MTFRRSPWRVASILAISLSYSPALASTRSIQLSNPTIVGAFADSIRAVVYAIPGLSGEAVESLIAGRARLEVLRAEGAMTRECSAAISCILEGPIWEEAFLEIIPSARVIGPGTSYFQVTGNLVEYRGLCDGGATLAAVLWGPTAEGAEFLEASIEGIRLLFDEDP